MPFNANNAALLLLPFAIAGAGMLYPSSLVFTGPLMVLIIFLLWRWYMRYPAAGLLVSIMLMGMNEAVHAGAGQVFRRDATAPDFFQGMFMSVSLLLLFLFGAMAVVQINDQLKPPRQTDPPPSSDPPESVS